ncbi:hypothetical protein [Mesorhizobium sp. WSM2561]|uniref:hypothetical protein n=1 Tax=Mesorhizobium sp. WSM2561 TaxID=1040985 RepID=UPI0012EC35F4|nr:hypothetical protein [Mesorhizobium sp. WSM2561]
MVKIGSYFRHYQFEHGLRMLEKGYVAARDALQAEIERTKIEAVAYEEALANGGEWIGELEDGRILWEQSQVYDAQIDDVHHALFEVRKAFVIALYHHWEHSAAGWKGGYAAHDELAKYCAGEGYGPSPELGAVQCLANHLKHGPNSRTDWLGLLRNNYPSFLARGSGFLFGLSEDDLYKVAATILASGPGAPRPDTPQK